VTWQVAAEAIVRLNSEARRFASAQLILFLKTHTVGFRETAKPLLSR
jgi:hypothetical protein